MLITDARWAAGVLLTLAFLAFAAANAAFFVGGLRKQYKGSSIPFVGGLAGVLGLFALPISLPLGLKLVPLVLDIGCLPMLVCMLIDLAIRRRDP